MYAARTCRSPAQPTPAADAIGGGDHGLDVEPADALGLLDDAGQGALVKQASEVDDRTG